MNDFVLVQVDQRPYDLLQIVLHFHLCQALPTLYQFIQGLVRTKLQQDVDVLVVLKHMFELHYVRMAQRFVDFNFSYQLRRNRTTFCLARERFKELLAMILAAEMRLLSKLVTS